MSKGASGVDHVDGMLPIPQLFAYGLQHVLAMYAGAVAVPIIIAQAMHLPIEDLIRLITADLFRIRISWRAYSSYSRCYICFCRPYDYDWSTA